MKVYVVVEQYEVPEGTAQEYLKVFRERTAAERFIENIGNSFDDPERLKVLEEDLG